MLWLCSHSIFSAFQGWDVCTATNLCPSIFYDFLWVPRHNLWYCTKMQRPTLWYGGRTNNIYGILFFLWFFHPIEQKNILNSANLCYYKILEISLFRCWLCGCILVISLILSEKIVSTYCNRCRLCQIYTVAEINPVSTVSTELSYGGNIFK